MIQVKIDMTGWKMWEHGVPDSRLTVIKQVEDYVSPSGVHHAQWLCECTCKSKTHKIFVGSEIRRGDVKSCGCIHSEQITQRNKSGRKTNIYDLSGEYGIGWTENTDQEFYFDLNDYDLIKDYCWSEIIDHYGYHSLQAYDGDTNKRIFMHHLLVGKDCDHKDRNPLNNRRNNLRKSTFSENCRNRSRRSDNTSGVIGVYWKKRTQKWEASVVDNDGHRKSWGGFTNKEDAIRARLEAEAKYYGEFAPQKHLFEKYGIV